MSNLLNPKVALFVQSGQADTFSPFTQMIWPGTIFSVLTTIAYGAFGAAAGGVSRWLAAHPTYMRNVNRASAGLFIASGAAILLADHRK